MLIAPMRLKQKKRLKAAFCLYKVFLIVQELLFCLQDKLPVVN